MKPADDETLQETVAYHAYYMRHEKINRLPTRYAEGAEPQRNVRSRDIAEAIE